MRSKAAICLAVQVYSLSLSWVTTWQFELPTTWQFELLVRVQVGPLRGSLSSEFKFKLAASRKFVVLSSLLC